MSEQSRSNGLEDELRGYFSTPEPSNEFVNALQTRLQSRAKQQQTRKQRPFYRRPVWVAVASVIIILAAAFFIIGPQRVYAEMRRLLGYIPGVGLVDSSAPIRVLAEPVEQTRDGVTITVASAVLTADRTYIEYHVFGVTRDAYPSSEDVMGCIQQEYLRLPDGTRLERMNDYPPVPANVNEAVLVIPCIAQTLPGKAPEAWIFPLRFVPAPPDMTVMPVEEVTETPPPAAGVSETAVPQEPTVNLAVTRVIDTDTGYVLIVSFNPYADPAVWVQQTGVPWITDEAGSKVAYSMPLDIQNSLGADENGGDLMAYKINAAGVVFPLTITYPGVKITVPDPGAQTTFVFDAGPDPQPGQEWQLNQQIELAGHTLTLVSVSADSRGGYSFNFQVDPKVYSISAQIEGFTPNGGGGGGGGGLTDGKFSVSLAYAVLPAGKLNVVLSNLSEVSDTFYWTAQWSPSTQRTDLPSTPQLAAGVCADANTIENLAPLPAEMSGKALISQFNPDGTTVLALTNLDGSGQLILSDQIRWASLSADGSKVVYSSAGGFMLQDIVNHTESRLNISGYNPKLSAHGTNLAYVEAAAGGMDVFDIENMTNRQISSQAYSAVVGWAPDDSKVYIAVMAAGGSAWQIQSVDAQTGAAQVLFVIENGSYKALNADLSPDGQWIAYRSRENSSVYLAKVDGTETRLLLDSPALGTSGITWAGNGWLAVSLADGNTEEQVVILVNPETCEAYRLPGLHSTLEGITLK